MNRLAYINALKEALFIRLNMQPQSAPLPVNQEELKAIIDSIAKIAFETLSLDWFNSQQTMPNPFTEFTSTNDRIDYIVTKAPQHEIIQRIEEFVQDNMKLVTTACRSGFPFLKLETSKQEATIRNYLSQSENSVVKTYIETLCSNHVNDLDIEQSCTEQLKNILSDVLPEELERAFSSLAVDQTNQGRFCFLWLLKMITGSSFEISKDFSTIEQILLHFFLNPTASVSNPKAFISIFNTLFNRLSHNIFNTDFYLHFLRFALSQLKTFSIDEWPAKSDLLLELLINVGREECITIADCLASQNVPLTAQVGSHLVIVLNAVTLKEAIPHYYALLRLIPNLTPQIASLIFKRPFLSFRNDQVVIDTDIEQSQFGIAVNALKYAFVHQSVVAMQYQSLIIGEYLIEEEIPYLIAFDMETEKMAWGIPLIFEFLKNPTINPATKESTQHAYKIQRIENGKSISITFANSDEVFLISPETGTLLSTFELEDVSDFDQTEFHITSDRYGYKFIAEENVFKVIGGQLTLKENQSESDNYTQLQFLTSFEIPTSTQHFLPFFKHCGLKLGNALTIIGPTGHQKVIPDCSDQYGKDNYLYLIENDPYLWHCQLKIKTLVASEEVFLDFKSITIEKRAFIQEICTNGTAILFSTSGLKHCPIFVDLTTETVTYSSNSIRSSDRYFVNNKTGDIWTWNLNTKKINKTSVHGTIEMGTLPNKSTNLIFVDCDDRLYFTD